MVVKLEENQLKIGFFVEQVFFLFLSDKEFENGFFIGSEKEKSNSSEKVICGPPFQTAARANIMFSRVRENSYAINPYYISFSIFFSFPTTFSEILK